MFGFAENTIKLLKGNLNRKESGTDFVSIPTPVSIPKPAKKPKSRNPNKPGDPKKYELVKGKWRRMSGNKPKSINKPKATNKSFGYGDPEVFSTGYTDQISIPGKATSFSPVETFTLSKTYLFAIMGFMYFYFKGKI